MSIIAVEGFVDGVVQGVYFRQNTKQQADALQVKGWVRNLADGRVAFLVIGEEEKVNQMIDWLRHGPPLAKVTKLESHVTNVQPFDEFVILP